MFVGSLDSCFVPKKKEGIEVVAKSRSQFAHKAISSVIGEILMLSAFSINNASMRHNHKHRLRFTSKHEHQHFAYIQTLAVASVTFFIFIGFKNDFVLFCFENQMFYA